MPVYEYRCPACGAVTEILLSSYAQTTPPDCTACGASMTRLISLVALGNRVNPGPGRRAWPSTWRSVNGGDPDTLRYWRHRIEREMKEEERNPELAARADTFRGDAAGAHRHSHQASPEPFVGPGVPPKDGSAASAGSTVQPPP